ncbi:MAG: HEPN domain-containing protein [Bradyrhizobium sp.]|nr:HEPN domain-containing protein [Bradyrhizobium sp.]
MTDVAEKSTPIDIPDHVVGSERMLLQAFNLWFNPEAERRIMAGAATFQLKRAQVIFAEGKAPAVRFNDEVRGSLIAKLTKPIEIGDEVLQSDVTQVDGFELDLADADAGHFTIYEWDHGQSWRIFFDFRRNRRGAAALVAAAEQFVAAAEFSLSQGHAGPFIDNLFSATELLAKARLITSAAESNLKSHSAIHTKINMWGKRGNVDARFVELFNELSNLRRAARYQAAVPTLKADDPVGRARAEIAALKMRLKRFSDTP